MAQANLESSLKPRVVVVGAGIGGIATGVALKRQLGFENFTIVEKASAVGGIWRDNTYPGCGSDVPGHWYCLSTDLNPRWTKYLIGQPEIRAYWEAIYDKYNLSAHTTFNKSVLRADWYNAAQLYRIVLEDSVTGQLSEIEAEIIIWAAGGFTSPTFPKDIPGRERFRGTLWHSARWRHDVDLKGKRVGVIGNGCSAAQFVPEISKDPAVEVLNFCRTPQWFVPAGNYLYPAFVKRIFQYFPWMMRFYRNFLMARADALFFLFRKSNTWLHKRFRRKLVMYIKQHAPKPEHDNLIPTYPPGCKRIVVDSGYLSSLKQPNVSLNWTPIEEIVEEGIKLKTGEIIPVDALIFGTGYSIEPVDFRVRGTNGSTAHEYFAAQGGPTAYLGTCMPGFPNLFKLTGPNVATGHASIIFSHEVQIQFAMQMIRPIIEGKARSFEVRPEATDEYNAWLQKGLSNSVWTECNSYYQVDGNSKTKIVATFPGPVTQFWWMIRRPRWDDFKAVGAEQWFGQLKSEARNGKRWMALMALMTIVALAKIKLPTGYSPLDIVFKFLKGMWYM